MVTLTRRSLSLAALIAGASTRARADDAPLSGTALMADLTTICAVSDQAQAAGLLDYGRIAGSAEDSLAAAWIERRMRAIGLSNIERSSYPLPDPEWRAMHCGLTLQNAAGQTLDLSSAFTPDEALTTGPDGVTAPLIDIGRGDEATLARLDLRGGIALLQSPVAGIAYDHPARQIVPRLMDRGLAGLIIAVRQPGDPQTRYAVQPGPLRFRANTLPWMTISGADAAAIEWFVGAGPASATTARMIVEGHVDTGLSSANVMGLLPGTGDGVVLVTAHIDSHWLGATDNASGLSLLLGLAAHFARTPRLTRTLVFVATGGHHNGPSSGQKHLIASRPDLIERCDLVVNLEHVASREPDPAGGLMPGPGPYVAFVPNQNPGLTRLIEAGIERHGVEVLRPFQTFWTADYYVYARLQIPAAMILQPSFWYHTEADTPDKIDPDALAAIARVHADLIAGVDRSSRGELRVGVPSLSYGN